MLDFFSHWGNVNLNDNDTLSNIYQDGYSERRRILCFGKNVKQMEFSYTVDGSVNCSTTLKNT